MRNRDAVIREVTKAYWMEMETVQNYLAHSVNLDGVRAEEIRRSLAEDVQAELHHAQALAKRLKILGGLVPGSKSFEPSQGSLQPSLDRTDVATVIRGVIDAEEGAIAQYIKVIELCEGEDYVTQDLCIRNLADEEEHRREFIGFLKEYAHSSSHNSDGRSNSSALAL